MGFRLCGHTHLDNSILASAHLQGAHLEGAALLEAELDHTNLEAARLPRSLTVEQVLAAWLFRSTQLPRELADDPRVKARIEETEAQDFGLGVVPD
ncbi:pentapeptide repeat-containing protein [Streptomyces sp. NBC_00853]|uniref:pentapeptide repeat-containing protein n=1 Tax=Streptomyces sp. NBC_00853 TaxID=2903681 RepID=UPI003873282A